jgi:hypothetical protein
MMRPLRLKASRTAKLQRSELWRVAEELLRGLRMNYTSSYQ